MKDEFSNGIAGENIANQDAPPSGVETMNEQVRCICPCCGHCTLRARGYFEMCLVCAWEDDDSDLTAHTKDDDPLAVAANMGPNGKLSLAQARANYRRCGAADPCMLGQTREPTRKEARRRPFTRFVKRDSPQKSKVDCPQNGGKSRGRSKKVRELSPVVFEEGKVQTVERSVGEETLKVVHTLGLDDVGRKNMMYVTSDDDTTSEDLEAKCAISSSSSSPEKTTKSPSSSSTEKITKSPSSSTKQRATLCKYM